MSELSAYGFRSDKAKTEIPDENDIVTLKKNWINKTSIGSLPSVTIPANTTVTFIAGAPNTAFPVPDIAIQKILNANNQNVPGGVTICLYRSWISDNGGQPGSRMIQLNIGNTNSFAVTVSFIVVFDYKPNGDPFPIGDAWEY